MNNSVVWAVLGTVFLMSATPARAHQAPDSACEWRLENASIYENLVDEAADFEGALLELESICRGGRCLREAQSIRADFTLYVDDLLERRVSSLELIRSFADIATRQSLLKARALAKPTPATPEAQTTILQFFGDPSKIPADQPVLTGNLDSVIRSVTFAQGVLFDFWELALHQQTKFLRAIFTGLVGPVNKAGVKVLHEHSKRLVEVKTFGTGARLFGCLKGGTLTILRVLPDHVHPGASLAKYRALCD